LPKPQPRLTDPDERLRFETLVADLASQFVNLPPDQVDGAIEDAQRRIVEALDLDRAALYEFVDTDGSLLFTHFWSRPEFPEPPRRQVTTAAFPWLQERLLRGETVIVPRLDDVSSGSTARMAAVSASSPTCRFR